MCDPAASINSEVGSPRLESCSDKDDVLRLLSDTILVDDAHSPVYLTNLAAALLKLGRFETAETTAHRALELDSTSVKARYRRAMARRALGKLPESLLDLYSLLVTDPGNREARSAYAAVLEIYNLEGKRCLGEIEIFIAKAPAAHGSTIHSSGILSSKSYIHIAQMLENPAPQCCSASQRNRESHLDRSPVRTPSGTTKLEEDFGSC
ncbi:hypothetical protein B0H14DRAFT_2644607 [Mycena olivaceomarginata]|nr:hypothetical protein B0H14DRAFT_2644607 [Mycena olivaceomarginata]